MFCLFLALQYFIPKTIDITANIMIIITAPAAKPATNGGTLPENYTQSLKDPPGCNSNNAIIL